MVHCLPIPFKFGFSGEELKQLANGNHGQIIKDSYFWNWLVHCTIIVLQWWLNTWWGAAAFAACASCTVGAAAVYCAIIGPNAIHQVHGGGNLQ